MESYDVGQLIKALEIIAGYLERIADATETIADQLSERKEDGLKTKVA